MARLGISLELITGTFLGDLGHAVARRPARSDRARSSASSTSSASRSAGSSSSSASWSRSSIDAVLRLMNFPRELLGSIISQRDAQAIDDIQRDPVGFLHEHARRR